MRRQEGSGGKGEVYALALRMAFIRPRPPRPLVRHAVYERRARERRTEKNPGEITQRIRTTVAHDPVSREAPLMSPGHVAGDRLRC